MSSAASKPCPLCHIESTVEYHLAKHSNHYICISCGELVIKQRADSRLKTISREVKNGWTEYAKTCPPGTVLFISKSPVPSEECFISVECTPLDEALKK